MPSCECQLHTEQEASKAHSDIDPCFRRTMIALLHHVQGGSLDILTPDHCVCVGLNFHAPPLVRLR